MAVGIGLLILATVMVFCLRSEPASTVTFGPVSYTNDLISLYVTNRGHSAVFLGTAEADWIVKPEANGQGVLLMWPVVDGQSVRQMFGRLGRLTVPSSLHVVCFPSPGKVRQF